MLGCRAKLTLSFSAMDRKQVIAVWLLHRRRKQERKRKIRGRRMYWVHPINQRRVDASAFITLFPQLREDENKFLNYFRMPSALFDELLARLESSIQNQNTQMRDCIQPLEMLALTIRYLASGCTFTDLHYAYRVGISTASKIVRCVCRAIWTVLRSEFLPMPTKGEWESIAEGFEKYANFPHCLGAVDGKHIRLLCPHNRGSMFNNYKEYYSVVIMGVSDSEYRFVYVNIGSFGKDCDSAIFKRCALWKSIVTDTQDLPIEKCLPGAEGPVVPYVFVGDEAFALHKHLLRPYGGSNLTEAKRIFNHRLSRARRYIESSFSILSNKWRIFHRPINVAPDFAVDIVKACIILHNFIRDRNGFSVEEISTNIIGFEDLPGEQSSRGGLIANNIRNIFCDYFESEVGTVP